jgi:putative transposase
MGGKRLSGRKRHLLVDTLGLPLRVCVHAADISDRDGLELVLADIQPFLPRLRLIWADQGYQGEVVEWVKDEYGLTLEIVKREPDQRGFKVVPRRWVVERTFGWLGRQRRLSKDYEYYTECSEAMIYLASLRLIMCRLAKPA